MALLICTGCTAAFAPGAEKCPQCGATDYIEQGEEQGMAKVTVHGGPTDALATESDEEAGEQSSAGKNSEPSSEQAQSSPKKSGAGRRKPAPTTESPSAQGRTGSSTAGGTAGDPTGPSSDGSA